MNAAALLAGRIWLMHGPALAALHSRLEGLGEIRLGPEPGPRPEPRRIIDDLTWPGYRIEDGVAHITIHDTIVNRDIPVDNIITSIFGGTITEHIRAALGDARTNKAVKGVLLDVDSPGGMADGTPETARMVRDLDARKPVVAHVAGNAASAAYYIASAAGSIVADPAAWIGSIGTVMGLIDDTEMLAKQGIKLHQFVSTQSPRKRPDMATEEGRAQVQEWADSWTDIFLADVANYRGTTPLRVMEDFGQGDILIASEAYKVGSIDQIGTRADALTVLRKRIAGAGKPASRARLSTPAARTGLTTARLAGAGSGRPVARLGAPYRCRVSSS